MFPPYPAAMFKICPILSPVLMESSGRVKSPPLVSATICPSRNLIPVISTASSPPDTLALTGDGRGVVTFSCETALIGRSSASPVCASGAASWAVASFFWYTSL